MWTDAAVAVWNAPIQSCSGSLLLNFVSFRMQGEKNAGHWLCDRSQPIKREDGEGKKKHKMNESKKSKRWEGRRHMPSVGFPGKAGRGVTESFHPAKAAVRLTPSSPSSQCRCLSRSHCPGCGSVTQRWTAQPPNSAALVKARVNQSSCWQSRPQSIKGNGTNRLRLVKFIGRTTRRFGRRKV